MPIHYYILGRILNSPTTLVLSFLGFLLAISGDVFFQLSPKHLKLPPVASEIPIKNGGFSMGTSSIHGGLSIV